MQGAFAALVASWRSSRCRARTPRRTDRGAPPHRRRPPARLRAAVAAQGDPARERATRSLHDEARPSLREVAAARGRGRPSGRRLVRLHPVVQGRPARGPGGGVHRDHVRRQPGHGATAAVGAAAAHARGRGRRGSRAGAAEPGAGEHDEVRGGRHAHLVRHVLGRRGAGIAWPGGDAAIAGLIAFTFAWSLLFTRLLGPKPHTVPA